MLEPCSKTGIWTLFLETSSPSLTFQSHSHASRWLSRLGCVVLSDALHFFSFARYPMMRPLCVVEIKIKADCAPPSYRLRQAWYCPAASQVSQQMCSHLYWAPSMIMIQLHLPSSFQPLPHQQQFQNLPLASNGHSGRGQRRGSWFS